MTLHDWFFLIGSLVLGSSVIANLMSVGITHQDANERDGRTTPAGNHFNFLHFFVLAGIFIGFTMLAASTKPMRSLQAWLDHKSPEGAEAVSVTAGSSTSSASASATATTGGTTPVVYSTTLPLPAGFTFDPLTGVLNAPANIPAGSVLVVKYDSATQPLTGNDLTQGRDMNGGKSWILPKDATNILVLYWDRIKNEATPFTSPF